MINNKKGISAVVATVLIILITVAAITIIWAAIIPMIKGTLTEGTACLNAVQALEIVPDFTCQDSDAPNKLSIQVGGIKDPSEITDIQFIISSNLGNTESKYLSDITGATVPTMNAKRVYTIMPTTAEAKRGVRIAPIIKSGAGTKTCDASAEFVLPQVATCVP